MRAERLPGAGASTTTRAVRLLLLTLLAALAAPLARAQESGWPTGEEIARRINARDEGETLSRSIRMQLIDKRGHERERDTRSFRKYYGADKKTAIFFVSPQSIRNTAFLTFDYADPERDDDQWIYLPALRKVRRISASDRGDSFFGTDLTYDDVKRETKVTIEDYHWKTVGEERLGDYPCYVLEALPVDDATERELGYSKVRSWVDSEIWMVRRADYWDIHGDLLKRVDVEEIRLVQGIWTPHRIEVRNVKKGHRSIFTFSQVDYAGGIDDDLFTERMLRRGAP
jgi:outer membrane lipoprotein-sorting protein